MSKLAEDSDEVGLYAEGAAGYLADGDEGSLYRIAMLGRSLLRAGRTPSDLVGLHIAVTDELLTRRPSSEHRRIVATMGNVLIEAMAVFSESHQEVRLLLGELRQRYGELDQTRHELEASRNALRDRTAELVQSAKLSALGELAAGVAHELNQPLNVIKIISQDLHRSALVSLPPREELEECLAEVIEQTAHMAEIVAELRRFTRKTEGSSWTRLDLNEPVLGVFRLLGKQLSVSGVAVAKELTPGLWVQGDPVRLQQVIMNLVSNAAAAVRDVVPSMRSIAVSTHRAQSPDGLPQVVCEIGDSGPGIAPELWEKVFEPFYTTKPPGEGTGLGLSVCRQIVEEHEGSIELGATPQGGSLFSIRLPAVNAAPGGSGSAEGGSA